MEINNIIDAHEEIYLFLEKYRQEERLKNQDFYYTLRKSNQKSKLDEGFWFYGNENYLAVSFWDGMDWKNRTPNVFFRITRDGRTFLTVTTKDSIKKSEYVQRYFVDQLRLKPNGKDRWMKEYLEPDYIKSLMNFLNSEKKTIDEIIKEKYNLLLSEDEENRINFISASRFQKWYEKIQNYRIGQKTTQLPYSLKTFSVAKYGPITSTGFSLTASNTQFIVFVGENGSGKSSLLKALATAVGNSFYEDSLSPENSSWIINFSINFSGDVKSYKISDFESHIGSGPFIPFAGFGPSRLMIDNRSALGRGEIREKTSPLRSLFYPDAILRDINAWLLNKSSATVTNRENTRVIFENIKQMMIDTIPRLYDIRETEWDRDYNKELLYYEEDLAGDKIEKGVIFEHLSSGLRSLIAMLGDMMLRLFEQQPDITDPAELGGIVLIDEIDIHLHPNWQKKVPQILSENFPKVQFILTTHSPIPLLGIPKKSAIYNVSRTHEKGVSIKSLNHLKVSNLLPNTILTSPIFGMEDLVSVNNANLAHVNVDDDMSDTHFFSLLDKKMNELEKKEEMFNKKYFS